MAAEKADTKGKANLKRRRLAFRYLTEDPYTVTILAGPHGAGWIYQVTREVSDGTGGGLPGTTLTALRAVAPGCKFAFTSLNTIKNAVKCFYRAEREYGFDKTFDVEVLSQ